MNTHLFHLAYREFAAPGTYEKLDCNGRQCATCGKCRDWYYTGDADGWKWIRGVASWTASDCRRYSNESGCELFKKRDGATCNDNYNNYCDYDCILMYNFFLDMYIILVNINIKTLYKSSEATIHINCIIVY